MKGKKAPSTGRVDPVFDQVVEQYADSVAELEKAEFTPGIETVERHVEKVKQRVSDAMHAFYTSYNHGYTVLLNALSEQLGPRTPDRDPLAPYRAKTDKIQIFEDPVAFMDFLTTGHAIYELLGFSPEILEQFYKTARRLVEEKRFEDARDGFYFLVTIAPMVGEAWLGLGYSYAQCKETEAAILALTQGVNLMPTKPDSYLTFCRVYIDMQDFEEAKKVCDLGIAHANTHKNEPWAKELVEYLQEAKKQIDILFQKSQYQSFSS